MYLILKFTTCNVHISKDSVSQKYIHNLLMILNQDPTLSISRNLSNAAGNCPAVFPGRLSHTPSCHPLHHSQKFWTILSLGTFRISYWYRTATAFQLLHVKKSLRNFHRKKKCLFFKYLCRNTCHVNAAESG